MALPSISVINFAPALDDRDIQNAIRSVNRQVLEDFVPIWGSARELRLHAPSFNPADPDVLAEDPVRGESVVYLVDEASGVRCVNSMPPGKKTLPYEFHCR